LISRDFYGWVIALTTLMVLPPVYDALAAPRPRVAVMEIDDGSKSFSAKDIQSASEYLRGRLAAAGKYIVIDRSRQAAKLKDMVKKEKKESYKQCYARNCQIPLGQALSADSILRTTLTRIGSRYTVSGELVDLAKEATVAGGFVEFKGEPVKDRTERLVEALRLVVAQLTGTYKGGRKGEHTGNQAVVVAEADLGEGGAGAWSAGGDPVLVRFASSPPGAVVLINGNMMCQKTPCTRTLPSGKTRVIMHMERYESREETLDLKEGDIRWELPPNFGLLTVYTTPSDLPVLIDDLDAGKTPLEKVKIEGGIHRILIRSSCHYEVGKRINLNKGDERILELNVEERPAGLKVTVLDPDGNAGTGQVFVDGESKGTAPGVFEVSVCARTLEVRRDGMETWKSDVELKEKETKHIAVELKREGNADWARVPAGTFTMGSEDGNLDEQPKHRVEVSRPFLMQVQEMSQGLWKSLYGNNPAQNMSCGDECPVERITWYEALDAANRLSERDGFSPCYRMEKCFGKPGKGMQCRKSIFEGIACKGYRLPTEAEWEYVAGMSQSADLNAVAWHGDNSGNRSHPGATRAGIELGVFDLLGNVAEWVFDGYDAEYYRRSSTVDPTGTEGSFDRGLRGCSYSSSPRRCGMQTRDKMAPGSRKADVGFRLVRSL